MDYRYKAIIANRRIYKEVELPPGVMSVKIGTTSACEARLKKELFFEPFEIDVKRVNGKWLFACSPGIYAGEPNNGVVKIVNKELNHGDEFVIKYQESNQELFTFSFVIDFDFENKTYDRCIDVGGATAILIGGTSNSNIYLNSDLTQNDAFSLAKENGIFCVTDNGTKYGVYVNGVRIDKKRLIGDFDFVAIAGFSFYLRRGKLYTAASDDIRVNGLTYYDMGKEESGFSYPKFNRNTRIKTTIPDDKIEILDPPALPQKPKSNILVSLLPAVMMMGLMVVMFATMSSGGGEINPGMLIFSVGGMGMGIVTSVISIVSNKKDYKKGIEDRQTKYRAYVENKRNEIFSIRQEELLLLNQKYPNSDILLGYVSAFSGDLFDKVPEDEDFLEICVGKGSVDAKREVDFKKQEKIEIEDELVLFPENIANESKKISGAPIVVNLAKANAVGVVGDNNALYDMFKLMLADICIRHYYNDVKLIVGANEQKAQELEWIRMLPHLYNDFMDIRNFISDDETKTAIFEYLYMELSNRESGADKTPHCVVLLYDAMGIHQHPVSRYIKKAAEYGFTFVFFENKKQDLPLGCTEILRLDGNRNSGEKIVTADSKETLNFAYSPIDDNTVSGVTIKLAPVYCEEVSLEGSLTKNISLYELLNIFAADDLDLTQRWNKSQVFKTMAAPLGVKAKGDTVYLDLHEKAHGPHGLVAGTTGSGKSEILQSYILSMGTLFHPYEVSFVIIDFKGGGMVNQFADMPHLVGAITNIDGKEIDRSLLSIKAELLKRQSKFAQYGVNHIDKYIQKYKNGEADIPLPHLIIVVDEFAELKAEQPEFMKELISAARIGRSLGVHLILATQKPSGQVNEQIWSNSRFKLCLKVQTKEDSNEVIKSPLASEIIEPGRAYLQVGNNELFELFQSAYSGASSKMDDNGRIRSFELYELDISGRKRVVYSQKPEKKDGETQTQLDALVEFIARYCKENAIKRLPNICLPPLPEILEIETIEKSVSKDGAMLVPMGIYDDPSNQYQGPAFLDVSTKNMMIIGSAQYGKTNILQFIIRSLASNYSPSEVAIYILDFGSMVLKNFETLKHVGGVVCSYEDEKLKNLIKMITGEIATRKEKLVAVGVSSFLSYREAGYTDLPQILLMIDNLTALRELYMADDDDELIYLCREGIAVGISIIVANSQTSGIGYRYLSNFSTKIALYCNDSAEYGNLFDNCRMQPNNLPGRCVLDIEKRLLECQSYLAFAGEKEIDRVKNMRDFIEATNKAFPDAHAKTIPVIPNLLTADFLAENYPVYASQPYKMVVGLDFANVEPFVLDICNMGALGLCGKENSGRGNFVRGLVRSLTVGDEKPPCEIHIIDDVSRKFADLKTAKGVKSYTLNAASVKDTIKTIEEEMQTRYDYLAEGEDEKLESLPLIVLIIQNNDVAGIINADDELLSAYTLLTSKYKSLKLAIVYANFENTSVSYSSPEPLRMLKDESQFLFFLDLDNVKVMEIPIFAIREFKKPLEIGDAYYVRENDVIKIKTALFSEA